MIQRHLTAALLVGAMLVSGCGKKASPPEEADSPVPPSPTTAQARDVDPEPTGKSKVAGVERDRLHRSFADATLDGGNAPAGTECPPDSLLSGKASLVVASRVSSSWDSIRFVSPAGKKIAYTAEIQTTHGNIRIELFPERAPNHVRNFIALTRAGYYDGLCFENLRRETSDEGTFDCIEGGCPVGRGFGGWGSIGYWLRDEPAPETPVASEEGLVGACRVSRDPLAPDATACRFYIGLTKAPYLTNAHIPFGKVVQGLDVARKIFENEGKWQMEGERHPKKPVTIVRVTISQQETDEKAK